MGPILQPLADAGHPILPQQQAALPKAFAATWTTGAGLEVEATTGPLS